jgi:protein-S-isoprenylcysteine O-methyltransferase Ste14
MNQTTEETKQAIQTGIRKKAIYLLLLGLVLFVPAGTLQWWQAWVFIGLSVIGVAFELLVLLPHDPELFAQRSAVQEGTKQWDTVLTVLSVLVFYAIALVIAGLDFRFGWTPPFALWRHILGIVLLLISSTIIYWAMMANTFFTSTVRIQTERSHQVCDRGLYAIVRHPGYAGALLTYIALPLILGSWWAAIPAALSIFGFILRTYLEDQTLRQELEGYEAYTKKVKYRLIPGIF